MSELKAWTAQEIANSEKNFLMPPIKVYLKSEADKVIAELEESHKKEVEQLLIEIVELKETLKNSRNARKYWRKEYLIEYKECCHQKYKRCLAMTKWCKAEQTYSSFAIYITEHPESRWANKSVGAGNWIAFWKNREQRWLALAEKFKETK